MEHKCKTRHRHPTVSARQQTLQLNQIKYEYQIKSNTKFIINVKLVTGIQLSLLAHG